MYDLNPARLQKLYYGDEIPVRRYQDGYIIVAYPSEANHIGNNSGINAFFLGATHIAAAAGAIRNYIVTRWASWPSLLALPFYNRAINAGKAAERVLKPVAVAPAGVSGS